MADKPKTVDQLKREYDRLAEQAPKFEAESREMLRTREAAHKVWVKERAAEKAKLMAAKLAAFTAWQAVTEAEAKSPPAAEAPVSAPTPVPAKPATVAPTARPATTAAAVAAVAGK
jgi:hypothetical protein